MVEVEAKTLDSTVNHHLGRAERELLKLDLQGYELEALAGETQLLEVTDVLLTEVSFHLEGGAPAIADLIATLSDRGFELCDPAALHARPRDGRPRHGDLIFVRRDSSLAADRSWE